MGSCPDTDIDPNFLVMKPLIFHFFTFFTYSPFELLEDLSVMQHCFFFLSIDNSPSTQINKVVSHPTLPLTVTAHEDRHIRFFDNNTGKKIKRQTVSWLAVCVWLTAYATAIFILQSSSIFTQSITRNHTSDNKMERLRREGPICFSPVWLQTELDDTKSYYQLIIKTTISEKKRIAKLW